MSDINLMKTDNLLFSERPVSIEYSGLKAARFWSFRSFLNILSVDWSLSWNFKCCNPASVLNVMNLKSSILLFDGHFFVINRRALNDEGAV